VKLIVGCTEDEVRKIMEFLNQTEFQKAIFIGRGHSDPSWASHE
jgi:inorganic pyrophosphatase